MKIRRQRIPYRYRIGSVEESEGENHVQVWNLLLVLREITVGHTLVTKEVRSVEVSLDSKVKKDSKDNWKVQENKEVVKVPIEKMKKGKETHLLKEADFRVTKENAFMNVDFEGFNNQTNPGEKKGNQQDLKEDKINRRVEEGTTGERNS